MSDICGRQGPADPASFVSWREFLARSQTSMLALVCLAVWLHAADGLVIATMLPTMVSEIGGAALVGWTVSLYEVGSVIAGAASALLTMRHGLRLPMVAAAAVFGVGCVVSAAGTSMEIVLVGRVLQGLGGGGLVAMSYVAVTIGFPRRYVPRALAAVSTFWGASAFLGPLVGGVFVEHASWRWGFLFFAGQAFVLAAWIAVGRDVDAGRGTASNRPTAGFPLGRLSILCAAIVLVSMGGVAIDPVRTTALVAVGLVCVAAFLWLDSQAQADRLLPLHPFDPRRSTGAGLLMLFSLSVAAVAFTAFGPLLMTVIHGFAPITIGYLVACESVAWSLAAISLSGSPEHRDRLLIAVGVAMIALSIVGFLYAVAEGPLWLIALSAALQGAGFGTAKTFVLRRIVGLADPTEAQRISGAMPTVMRVGYAFGAAVFGGVANACGMFDMETAADAATVARCVFVACLPFALIGVVAAGMFLRGRHRTVATAPA